MKLLLTSGGVTNASIRTALEELLGKPIGESRALLIPTAQWGHPMCGPDSVRGFIGGAGEGWEHSSGLGWGSTGVLELTALPTIGAERWVPWVREADVLFADGGDATYLCHWMRESGLAELLPSLDSVWVGISAGSMVMAPRIGEYFVEWASAPDDSGLGLVDFAIFPHLDAFPTNTVADAERWAATLDGPAYAIDESTAIRVVDGAVDVISEGRWLQLR